jgi:hypothetical protein
MATHFCDGLKEVTILNGVARLEFHRLQGEKNPGTNFDLQAVGELIIAMPAQGLVQALTVLEQVRDKLIRDGMLRPTPLETTEETQTAPLKSPNFA